MAADEEQHFLINLLRQEEAAERDRQTQAERAAYRVRPKPPCHYSDGTSTCSRTHSCRRSWQRAQPEPWHVCLAMIRNFGCSASVHLSC